MHVCWLYHKWVITVSKKSQFEMSLLAFFLRSHRNSWCKLGWISDNKAHLWRYGEGTSRRWGDGRYRHAGVTNLNICPDRCTNPHALLHKFGAAFSAPSLWGNNPTGDKLAAAAHCKRTPSCDVRSLFGCCLAVRWRRLIRHCSVWIPSLSKSSNVMLSKQHFFILITRHIKSHFFFF